MSDVPEFAGRRFKRGFRRLRLTDVYSAESGWSKDSRKLDFTTELALELLAGKVTQVRLRSRWESHDVSILEASLLRRLKGEA